MKLFAIILILAAGTISSAATKCYMNSKAKAAGLPAVLCIQNIGFYSDGDKGWLQVGGENTTGIYETEFTRSETMGRLVIQKNEGENGQPARAATIVLKISGNDYSNRNFDKVNVSIETATYANSCSSAAIRQKYQYKQIN